MGKKPFISKQNSTKYDLIFRSNEDASQAPQREWVESSRKIGIGKPDLERVLEERSKTDAVQRYPPGHPLSWLQSEEQQAPLSEERRKEIISLGFPDDGYDYLKHIRQGHAASEGPSEAVGTGGLTHKTAQRSANEESGGPSVFIPAPAFEAPPDDYRAIDACRLTIHQAANDDDDAALVGLGAKAFSRDVQTVRRKFQMEIDEMEDLLKQLDGRQDGEGDLLEDFVLTATETQEQDDELLENIQELQEGPQRQEEEEGEEEDLDVEVDSDASSSDNYHPRAAPSENKSFASTYWRPERVDRNANLSVIDERFEQLALEYDSDDIGELDQLADDPSTRGVASTDQYSKIFDQFLSEHATKEHRFEGGQQYHVNEMPNADESSNAEAELINRSVAMAKDYVQRLEQQEAEPRDPVEQNPYPSDDDKRETWDCESVLSTRSNLYNHPTKLDALPPRRRTERQQIRLSHKTGLPLSNQMSIAETRAPHPTKLPQGPSRKHDESSEDRKVRKQAVKEAKREARASKKEMKNIFKEQAQKQNKQASNLPVSIATMS